VGGAEDSEGNPRKILAANNEESRKLSRPELSQGVGSSEEALAEVEWVGGNELREEVVSEDTANVRVASLEPLDTDGNLLKEGRPSVSDGVERHIEVDICEAIECNSEVFIKGLNSRQNCIHKEIVVLGENSVANVNNECGLDLAGESEDTGNGQ